MPTAPRPRLATIALLLCGLSTACTDSRAIPADAATDRLESRQTEFFAALTARDADRLAGFFADSAVLHIADRPPVEGRAAIGDLYGTILAYLSDSRATPTHAFVSRGADLAYSIGGTVNEFRGPEGPQRYSGKYLLVWRMIDDDWYIVAYSISSD